MIPEARDSVIYFSMASVSGAEREYRCLLGSVVPGSNGTVLGTMRRKGAGLGAAEHLAKVVIFTGHFIQINCFLLLGWMGTHGAGSGGR